MKKTLSLLFSALLTCVLVPSNAIMANGKLPSSKLSLVVDATGVDLLDGTTGSTKKTHLTADESYEDRSHKFTNGSTGHIKVFHPKNNSERAIGLFYVNGELTIAVAGLQATPVVQLGETILPTSASENSWTIAVTELEAQKEVHVYEARDLNQGELKKVKSSNINKTDLQTISKLTTSLAATATSLPTYSRLRYQTFIPDDLVLPVAPAACPLVVPIAGTIWYFEGNNRSYSPGTSNNKTLLDIRYNWTTQSTEFPIRNVGFWCLFPSDGVGARACVDPVSKTGSVF
ncbi:MAG: hypothetical protein RL545_229 [Actinomycetota bacterium]